MTGGVAVFRSAKGIEIGEILDNEVQVRLGLLDNLVLEILVEHDRAAALALDGGDVFT